MPVSNLRNRLSIDTYHLGRNTWHSERIAPTLGCILFGGDVLWDHLPVQVFTHTSKKTGGSLSRRK